MESRDRLDSETLQRLATSTSRGTHHHCSVYRDEPANDISMERVKSVSIEVIYLP